MNSPTITLLHCSTPHTKLKHHLKTASHENNELCNSVWKNSTTQLTQQPHKGSAPGTTCDECVIFVGTVAH